MGRDTKGQDKLVRSDEHNSRGIELADRGWLDEAIKEFKKAIELDPESAHAHDNLATVYSKKKLYTQALEEYLTALKLEPESATAHYNLACFLATHAHEMAIEQYKEAIAQDPEYPDAHLNLGMTYADLDQRDEAKAEFKAAIELDPGDPLARHELAAMLMDEGDTAARSLCSTKSCGWSRRTTRAGSTSASRTRRRASTRKRSAAT